MFIGIDIVEIGRIEAMAKRHEKALQRFFTPAEIAYCNRREKSRYHSLAGIFAAKEAFFKALGTGFRQGPWHDVEVDHDRLGAPFLRLSGVHALAAAARSTRPPAVSISHDGDYAVAQVIWEEDREA